MPETMVRFKLKDVRLVLECKSCCSEVIVNPFKPAKEGVKYADPLRWPRCNIGNGWGKIEESFQKIVIGMSALNESDVVEAEFGVLVQSANTP
jgi:hypothetical protein